MRFGLAPVRGKPKDHRETRYRRIFGENTYGLLSDSESSEQDSEGYVVEDDSDSDYDGKRNNFCYASESEVPPKPKSVNRLHRTTKEEIELSSAIASIRLHANYQDPLEEWQRQVKMEAFENAQQRQRESKTSLVNLYLTAAQMTEERIERTRAEQLAEVEHILTEQRLKHEEATNAIQAVWEQRTKQLWESVDRATAIVKARLEEEQRAIEHQARKQEEERRKKEEVDRLKKEQEEADRKRVEEEKRKKEAEEKKQREKEEQEKRDAEAKLAAEKAELDKYEKERRSAGFTTVDEDWRMMLNVVKSVKHGAMKNVKADTPSRKELGNFRRYATGRVGQITNSEAEVIRISTELTEAIKKYPPGSEIYAAALYTLGKAVLLQAEQEVTAKIDTAAPLSRVCVNLLTLPGFAQVLWARLVARSGGWIIGKYIEKQPGQSDKEFKKLNGILNEDETQLDRQTRISGLIQLYFAICIAKTAAPLPVEFRPQRIWNLFARILGDKRLLRQTMSLSAMHATLEVVVMRATEIFGRQWTKLLYAIGNATVDPSVGGKDDLAKTARVRLQQMAEDQLKRLGAW